MIHNADLNLLFVHIQKTAGTSIHQALLAEPGSVDLPPHHLRLRDLRLPRARPRIVAVVRNPWERLVSWYRMMLFKGCHNDFSAYLLAPDAADGSPVRFSTFLRRTATIQETSRVERQRSLRARITPVRPRWGVGYPKSIGWNQVDYLTVNGRLVADEVLRFERLDEQWEALGRRLIPGRGWSRPLPKANEAPKDGFGDWRALYDDGRDVDHVRQLFARDIAYFGFHFDP